MLYLNAISFVAVIGGLLMMDRAQFTSNRDSRARRRAGHGRRLREGLDCGLAHAQRDES